MSQRFRVPAAAVFALGLLCACADPGFERAKVLPIEADGLLQEDLIGYRVLRVDDFRAPDAPPEVKASRHTVGGYTCLNLLYEGPIPVTQLSGRGERFRATLEPRAFRAYMNRGCSWLNRSAPLPPEYILEHEQIHFALWEIQARRMNREREAIRRQVESVAQTEEAAVQAAKSKIEKLLERTLRDLQKQSEAFDDDTSGGYFPDRQKKWLARVRSALSP